MKYLKNHSLHEFKKTKNNIVYHGSPYDFDQFSSNRVGSGEGASGFGFGIYFTNDKEDAIEYARKLEREKGEARLYTCNIPDKDKFLDIDKDLDQQSLYVQTCIKNMPKNYKIKLLGSRYEQYCADIDQDIINGEFEESARAELYDAVLDEVMDFGNDFYDRIKEYIGRGEEYNASEFLYRLGIKGNVHTGFHHTHYVVFDDQDIQILKVTKPKFKYHY